MSPGAMSMTSTGNTFAPSNASRPGGPNVIVQGQKGKAEWVTVPGKASDSAKATAAYNDIKRLAALYPTTAALRKAGFVPEPGSRESHWQFPPGIKRYSDGTAWIGSLMAHNGVVTGGVIGSSARQESSPVAAGWSGVQWHYHNDKTAGWMSHVMITMPIDLAFSGNMQ